jgi:hypothetical protein
MLAYCAAGGALDPERAPLSAARKDDSMKKKEKKAGKKKVSLKATSQESRKAPLKLHMA